MKIFSKWLRDLFSRKIDYVVEYSDTEKSIWYKTKGILGFKLIKKYIDLNYKSYGIHFYSHLDDEYSPIDKNYISININHTTYTILTPFKIIKPILDYISHYDKINEDGIRVKVMYKQYVVNEYSIFSSYQEDRLEYIFINISHPDSPLYNMANHRGFSKHISMFWNYQHFINSEMLDPITKEVIKDITYMSTDDILMYINDENPSAKQIYTFIDYDKTEIIAEVYLNKQNYEYGNSWLTRKIMKLFKKPISYIRYNIIYSNEVGRGKENWKGGTTAASGLLGNNSIPTVISRSAGIPRELIKPYKKPIEPPKRSIESLDRVGVVNGK